MIVPTAWLLGLAFSCRAGQQLYRVWFATSRPESRSAVRAYYSPIFAVETPPRPQGNTRCGGCRLGPHHLTIRRLGYAPRTLDVIVPPSGEAVFNLTLRPVALELSEIVVRPRIPVRDDARENASKAFVGTAFSAGALRHHPLLAEPDAFEALVGGEVVMRPEAPAGLHVRGGGSDQVAFLLDGIPILSPYHPAGAFSALQYENAVTVQVLCPTSGSLALVALLALPAPRRGMQPIDGWLMLGAYALFLAQAFLPPLAQISNDRFVVEHLASVLL